MDFSIPLLFLPSSFDQANQSQGNKQRHVQKSLQVNSRKEPRSIQGFKYTKVELRW